LYTTRVFIAVCSQNVTHACHSFIFMSNGSEDVDQSLECRAKGSEWFSFSDRPKWHNVTFQQFR